MFTDTHSRGEIWRANQGNAFVPEGFSNRKKQNERIKKHEQSAVHQEAKIGQVLFQSSLNIEPLLEKQQEACEDKRKRNVIRNREIVERIIDVIFLLGKQGSSIRGHNEKLSLEAAVNNGNFLETLKLLAKYDSKIHEHFLKVESEQSEMPW